MPDLLIELFSEEIPARMQRQAAEDLKRLVTNALVERNLIYEGAQSFVTPRRLALLEKGKAGERHLMALPAYDQCIKASHVFNLLDARGVISVTERQSYILRVRELAKACGEAWIHTEAGRAT